MGWDVAVVGFATPAAGREIMTWNVTVVNHSSNTVINETSANAYTEGCCAVIAVVNVGSIYLLDVGHVNGGPHYWAVRVTTGTTYNQLWWYDGAGACTVTINADGSFTLTGQGQTLTSPIGPPYLPVINLPGGRPIWVNAFTNAAYLQRLIVTVNKGSGIKQWSGTGEGMRDDLDALARGRSAVVVGQVRVVTRAVREHIPGSGRGEHRVERGLRDATRDVATVDQVVVALRRVTGALRLGRELWIRPARGLVSRRRRAARGEDHQQGGRTGATLSLVRATCQRGIRRHRHSYAPSQLTRARAKARCRCGACEIATIFRDIRNPPPLSFEPATDRPSETRKGTIL